MTKDHLRVERFGQERRLLGQVAMFRAHAPAADDDLDSRVVFGNVTRECEPVGVARHIDVGEQERDGVGVFREHSDCGITATRFVRAEARIFEDPRDIHKDERFVVDCKGIGNRR